MKEVEAIAVSVDGKPHSMPAGSTLSELIASLGHEPNQVTSAVNGMFVARGQRESRRLQPGDAVLLFKPIEGG
jgi:sulfur carrier protein